MKFKNILLSMALGSLLLSSCGKDEPKPKLDFLDDDNDSEQVDGADDEGAEEEIVLDLEVKGKDLVDKDGKTVVMHGMCQTYAAHFNQGNWGWDKNYTNCLNYNKRMLKTIMDNGWGMDFVRLHMDPYWTTSPSGAENLAHKNFSEKEFKSALRNLFIPMAEYMQSLGLRVVMRPPGVAPKVISLGDDYQKYLFTVWTIVATNPKIKNNSNISFELANEPIDFKDSKGATGAEGTLINKEYSKFFQQIADSIRALGCYNILWVPGTSWQQNYKAFAKYPIKGRNIGYAVHCYPGWYGSDCFHTTAEVTAKPDPWRGSEGGYTGFKRQFEEAIITTVGNKAPVLITEMDWSHNKFWSDEKDKDGKVTGMKGPTWGCAITGEAGGAGFGANFKKIMDEFGVSYVTFVWQEDLAKFDPKHKPDSNVMIYDPESGCLPVYSWYRDYWKEQGKIAE